jgi:hypothetical protein
MKTNHFRKWWAAIALASLPFLCLGADDLEKPSPNAAPPAPAKTLEGTCFDLDIVNGVFEKKPGQRVVATVENLASWLREKLPGKNLVLSPTAGEISIANLHLRAASLEDFLQALTIAADGRLQWRPLGNSGQSYALMGSLHPSAYESTVEVFNLSTYLSWAVPAGPDEKEHVMRIEAALADVEKIIKETIKLLNATTGREELPYVVKFHPGANLLVVVGSPNQLAVVRKVVMALNPANPSPGETKR